MNWNSPCSTEGQPIQRNLVRLWPLHEPLGGLGSALWTSLAERCATLSRRRDTVEVSRGLPFASLSLGGDASNSQPDAGTPHPSDTGASSPRQSNERSKTGETSNRDRKSAGEPEKSTDSRPPWSPLKRARNGQQDRNWFQTRIPEWLPKRLPQLQPFWVILAPPGQPDKKRLMTVQDFFKYTEEEGRQFWTELDADSDGRISADDVKRVLRKRKLPESYANDFIKAARGNRWWSNSIDWENFKAMVDEREPKMLRAFTSMEVTPAGGLEQRSIKDFERIWEVLTSPEAAGTLAKVGVDASDEHAKAMIKAIGMDDDGVVSYGKFRNFLILLPEAKLTGIDPSAVWFEAATMVPFGPPPSERSKEQRTGKMLLTAALAGGIASCVSTVTLFPLDTLKTRLQSTAGATIASIAKSAPDIGARGLYRGIIPAAMGNFVSHGVRTFSYEASFSALTAFSGGAAELQIQGLSSGIGTFLGTCIRIPCEVLKQRLQTGRHPNLVEALRAATKLEGPRGLFRGTVATLSREVPFYVLGIVFFEQLKKVAKGNSFGGQGRDLAPWETIALGALAGALASVGTTPADVMKTRVMTAAADTAINPREIFVGIIKNEGVGALFKGAWFRAAWTAPQGAMNFSGYELAKKALSQRQVEHGQEGDLQAAPGG